MKNNLTTKDVLTSEMLQKLSPNTLVVTHSAGNPDIDINVLVGAKTPYNLISISSPTKKSDLDKSTSKVGANLVTQKNHLNDPVIIPNMGANYDIDFRVLDDNNEIRVPFLSDLLENHPFEKGYPKIKPIIKKLVEKNE